ncbi:MAG: hypothetical protein P8Y82_10980 [Methyloceanibacter sp.]
MPRRLTGLGAFQRVPPPLQPDGPEAGFADLLGNPGQFTVEREECEEIVSHR